MVAVYPRNLRLDEIGRHAGFRGRQQRVEFGVEGVEHVGRARGVGEPALDTLDERAQVGFSAAAPPRRRGRRSRAGGSGSGSVPC